MTERNGREQHDDLGRMLVDDPAEIPTFHSDEEELEDWRAHTPSDKFFAHGELTTLEVFPALQVEVNPPR